MRYGKHPYYETHREQQRQRRRVRITKSKATQYVCVGEGLWRPVNKLDLRPNFQTVEGPGHVG